MTDYYLLVGRFPELAFLEISTVFSRLGFSQPQKTAHPAIFLAQIPAELAASLPNLLGSVIKVYQPLTSSYQVVTSQVSEDIITFKPTRCAFSSLSSGSDLNRLAAQIKQRVRQTGHSFGYRLLDQVTESAGISPKVPEYLITGSPALPKCLKSVSIQNLDWWAKKDYGRPAVQPKSGMLPPKVARQLVNLAFDRPLTPESVLLDPFCGVGTVLAEALELGIRPIGSDIDPLMIKMSQANLTWLADLIKPAGQFSLHQADAQKPLSFIPPQSLDAVVFEGYLGPPDISLAKIPDYLKGLTKMYLGVLKNIQPLLKPDRRLVAALPAYYDGHRVKILKNLIDRCENLGYTPLETLWYYRPQARIRRQIIIWQKR